MEIKDRVEQQREFFNEGWTLDTEYRKEALVRLKEAAMAHEDEVSEALQRDLGKSAFEAYATEIGLVYKEINYMIRHLDHMARPEMKPASVSNFPSVTQIIREPYGTVLIMAPWNYPFQLALIPLAGAVAAGNCAVVKPSAYSPAVSDVIEKIISETFDERYVFTVTGGREVNKDLLSNKFDYIFFTGGKTVGKTVMKAAAENLTPVTLELGGKSPCIVDRTADIALAARRIVWGKFINCGQTCVAPDYIYVQRGVKEKLLKAIVRNIEALYGENPVESKDYGKIVNEKHFDRLMAMIEGVPLYYGGETERENLKIGPAVIDDADWSMAVMKEEIFGPVLPVLEFDTIGDVISKIKSEPRPLALYLFTKSPDIRKLVLKYVPFGGGCVNDTVMHLSEEALPFGGTGESGMGGYHGRYSFRTFSHEKSVLRKSTLLDVPLRYPPYGRKLKILKMFLH